MKKFIICFSALALISSCAKVEVTEPVQDDLSNDSNALYADLPKVIYASVSDESGDSQTRTFVDGKSVKWHRGESISYYAGTYGNVKYTMKEGQYDGTVNAEFVKDGNAQYTFDAGGAYGMPEYSLAVYPYDETQIAAFNSGKYNALVKFAKEQTYAQNSFGKGANIMVATGSSNDDENLYFRNACGYLVIKLFGTDTRISNITLTTLGEGVKISGAATLIVNQNEPVQFNQFKKDEAYSTVTLDCSNGGQGVALGADAGNATEFWFALPPVNIEGGIKIVVTDVNGATFTKQTTKDINITRNKVQPMAALQFVAHTPPLNKIWYTKTAEAMAEEGGKDPIAFGNGQTNPFDATITDHRYDSSTGKFVIEFDTHLKIIKAKAFYDTDIQTIELPHSLETIEDGAFEDTQIQAITIPGSVNTIKTEAFNGCRLMSIEFLPSPTQTPLTIAYIKRGGGIIGSFCDATFTSINLNREVAYVDTDGKAYTPGESDDALFSHQFEKDLVSLSIGDQVKTIHNYMFAGLNIDSITIPGSVMEIKDDAFKGCTNLSSIRFEASALPLTIGFQPAEYAIQVEHGPFYQSPLTDIYVNRELVASASYAAARDQTDEGIFSINESIFFSNPPATVTLQGNVKTISDYMFSGLNIKTIWIPREVTTIGKSAFENCSKLYGVTLAHSTPPTLGVDAFDGTLLQDKDENRWIALEVGTEANIKAFKEAENWSEYADIIKAQIKK